MWAYLDLPMTLCQGCRDCTKLAFPNTDLLEIPYALQYRQDEDKEVTHEDKADLPYWIALQ